MAVSDQDLNLGQVAVHREVAGLLDDPGTTRTVRDTGEMRAAGPELGALGAADSERYE
jgi:hypothetical protein